jgi:hypothetical protein
MNLSLIRIGINLKNSHKNFLKKNRTFDIFVSSLDLPSYVSKSKIYELHKNHILFKRKFDLFKYLIFILINYKTIKTRVNIMDRLLTKNKRIAIE